MKTFKQHVKEGYKQGKYGAGNVGTPEVNSVEDGSIGVHNIHDPKVLERVNGFVGSIANQEYLNPKVANNTQPTKNPNPLTIFFDPVKTVTHLNKFISPVTRPIQNFI